MDTTTFFCKIIPECTLAANQIAGFKEAKSRVTADFYFITSGTNRLLFIYISTLTYLYFFALSGIDVSRLLPM